jgi:small GTP-binding protein
VEVGPRIAKISLWDTAGQEKFRAIAPLYTHDARAAIIVASTDLLDSFHSIPSWLELLDGAHQDSVPAIMAINKCDLKDPWTDDAIAGLVERHRARFVTVFAASAVTGDQVAELFQEAARIAEFPPAARTEPTSAVEEKLEERKCC